ncbi:multidrug ABC transporter permease [Zavarzinia compransoris]|uniref:Transport permease protein n=2 Tax=Zavarzinia compransoris TaxID=1264899 RepID=A0A317E741_9PROT|nr:ABC transporter permease [Zavarzinia compransoris]PWR22441.1 multidrug ABC transporter permease [Zavarzinia compransoris]
MGHALGAAGAIVRRELRRFVEQRSRLASALVRPLLWLMVFAAGFQNVFGVSIIPPYQTYVTYQVYVLPGLAAMVLLFNGMQSSLSLVYDREMGMMRLLLTAPLPRWWLLLAKLAAGVALSLVQVYAFLGVAALFDVRLPALGYLTVLPALVLAALMLGAIGLLLSATIRQLENFAGAMNFVIFPMFFLSSALYPLWKIAEAAAAPVHYLCLVNPFTYAVELIRFAAYGEVAPVALGVVLGVTAVAFALACRAYDPQRGLLGRARAQPA